MLICDVVEFFFLTFGSCNSLKSGSVSKRQISNDSDSEAEKTIPKKKKSAWIDSYSEPLEQLTAKQAEDIDTTEIFVSSRLFSS